MSNLIPYIMIYYYKQMRQEKMNTLSPAVLAKPITEFLRDAYGMLTKDMQTEGVKKADELKLAKNFLAFCEDNKEIVEAFGLFIGDHQGYYDKLPRCYNWQTLEPFTEAVFRFGVKMSNKHRLLEITKKYRLAVFAMDDDNVVRFVLANFDKYAEIKEKFKDEHGRAITLLEALYLELCKSRGKVASPHWALEVLIKKLCYGI